uniref:Vesicle transport protein n=1 Tax=Trichuris muris TaxID=70415 RepID=A0A5S6R207_TRIMR
MGAVCESILAKFASFYKRPANAGLQKVPFERRSAPDRLDKIGQADPKLQLTVAGDRVSTASTDVCNCLLLSQFVSLLPSGWVNFAAQSICWKSTLLTVLCVATQLATLIWFLFHYIPGGERAIRFFTSVFGRSVRSNLNAGSSSSNLPI